MPVADGDKKVVRVPYIHYLVKFHRQESQDQVRALLYSSSNVIAKNLAYTQKLGLHI